MMTGPDVKVPTAMPTKPSANTDPSASRPMPHCLSSDGAARPSIWLSSPSRMTVAAIISTDHSWKADIGRSSSMDCELLLSIVATAKTFSLPLGRFRPLIHFLARH